jgi:aquaporin Z
MAGMVDLLARALIGMLAATVACSYLANRIEVAKLYHFDSDRGGIFRRMSKPARART